MIIEDYNYTDVLWIAIPIILLILGLIGFFVFRKRILKMMFALKSATQSKIGKWSFISGIVSIGILAITYGIFCILTSLILITFFSNYDLTSFLVTVFNLSKIRLIFAVLGLILGIIALVKEGKDKKTIMGITFSIFSFIIYFVYRF